MSEESQEPNANIDPLFRDPDTNAVAESEARLWALLHYGIHVGWLLASSRPTWKWTFRASSFYTMRLLIHCSCSLQIMMVGW